MKAMVLSEIVSLTENMAPLKLVDLPIPEPAAEEILLRVSVCGVCHTELDEIEGRTAPPKFPIVLGHEVVGRVEQRGTGVTKWNVGDRVGVGWIHHSTGAQDENLTTEFRATGRDVNGGYAEYMTVPQDYAYAIPDSYTDQQAAPLLCAGAVGFRALKLANWSDGGALGLMGFGGSAHLVLQAARHLYPQSKAYVFARGAEARKFALELGAEWAGDITDRSPVPLDAIIDTTPVWKPVVESMANLRPGGRLVINAIRKEDLDKDYLLQLDYHSHLWMEKEIKTVANVTQYDLRDFLALAGEMSLQPAVTAYPLERANEALLDLKRGNVRGAKVLEIAS